jgi:hypothetical protein
MTAEQANRNGQYAIAQQANQLIAWLQDYHWISFPTRRERSGTMVFHEGSYTQGQDRWSTNGLIDEINALRQISDSGSPRFTIGTDSWNINDTQELLAAIARVIRSWQNNPNNVRWVPVID